MGQKMMIQIASQVGEIKVRDTELLKQKWFKRWGFAKNELNAHLQVHRVEYAYSRSNWFL